jgi:hypothetical protein
MHLIQGLYRCQRRLYAEVLCGPGCVALFEPSIPALVRIAARHAEEEHSRAAGQALRALRIYTVDCGLSRVGPKDLSPRDSLYSARPLLTDHRPRTT